MAGPPQKVVELVRRPSRRPQLPLHIRDRVSVEEIPELLDAGELTQQVAVERQSLRTPLRGRRVVLVHVVRDVVEEKRGRIGRGGRRLDVDDVELPRAQAAQEPLQRRQVEDVLEALAVRLEHDRELAVPARDLEQALRLEALLPERCPLPRPAARDEQRARSVLAESGAEERAAAELG